jgi:hypothetical protein
VKNSNDEELVVQAGVISAEYNFYVEAEEYEFFLSFAGEPEDSGFHNVDLESAINHPEFRKWTPTFETFGLAMQQLWGKETMALPNSKHIVSVEIGSAQMALAGLFPMIILVHPPFTNVGQIRPLVEGA